MSDAEYLFNERMYGAKRLARGAYSKKCGSRSKKCSLPSDRLTKKEMKERNGEMSHYKLREPMSWKEFKDMPDDLQCEYLQFLVNEKKARLRDIANMFGMNANYLGDVLKTKPWYKGLFHKGGSATVSKEWQAFLGAANYDMLAEPKPEPTPEPVETPKSGDTPPSGVKLEHDGDGSLLRGILNYNGHPMYVFNEIFKILDANAKYDFVVSFSRKEADK